MSNGAWLPIRCRDFYDVPRLVAVEHQGSGYLLDSPFDEEAGEYADHYTVYRLPGSATGRLDEPSWAELPAAGEARAKLASAYPVGSTWLIRRRFV
jgi:hypothetical protein